jgi:hypothetical protein
LLRHLDALAQLTPERLLVERHRRLAGFGVFFDSKT